MTSALSSIAPTALVPRESPTTQQTYAARTTAAVGAVETPRAPQPVTGVHTAAITRNQVQRERPVGPPPSFEINVIQDIRDRLADPPPVEEVLSEDPPPPPEGETEPDTPAPLPQAVLGAHAGPGDEAPHALDMRV